MNKSKGFTLIELLVVMAILSILMALLLPAIQTAKEKAKGNLCLTHMRQIALAINIFANENEGQLPHTGRMGRNPGAHEGGYVYGGNYVSFPQDENAVTRIMIEDGVIWTYVYPGKERFREMDDEWYRDATKNVYLCPSASPPGVARGFSYALNCFLECNENGVEYSPYRGVGLTQIKNHAKTVMLVDEDGYTCNDGHFMPQSNVDIITPNHMGGGNLTFCDFHASWMKREELEKYVRNLDNFHWWR